MKKGTNKVWAILFATATLFACQNTPKTDPLPSWNNTEIKQQLIEFIGDKASAIPEEDRIAVFDMDGTIACETPLWFEIAVAAQKMAEKAKENPALLNLTEYQYAQKLSENPNDTTVLNHWNVNGVNYMDSVIMKAFEQIDHETYIQYAHKFLTENKPYKYGKHYADLFYQPMLELIDYLKEKKFQIYIVSGSVQGVVWSICPQTIGLDRQHLLGTNQTIQPVYTQNGTEYRIQKSIYQPKNDGNGKTCNIYSHLGKTPVMAVGNTTGDFGMFHLVSTSKYPHLAMMINHDDAEREYAYEPYHGTAAPHWKDSLRINHWLQADMSKEFKTVWMNRSK